MSCAMIVFLIFGFHLLGFISAIHAIMSVRTEPGAIAWAVSLNSFPYLAVPAYWILGRSRFEGYITARRGALREFSGIDKGARKSALKFKYSLSGDEISWQAAERLAGLPFSRGNSTKLLIDGGATFESILKGVDSAEHYILFQFFIVHDDEIGREVKKRLIARSRAGVKIYFLYDEIGSHDLPTRYLEDLRSSGIEIHDFHTRKGSRNRFQLNFRNHRKIVVVDGKFSWVGGHNVGDEYLGRDAKFGHWRDTHLRIEGPAALAAQLSFVEDWHWSTGETLELNWEATPSPKGDLPILVIPSGPADMVESANLLFVHAINTASRRIWIASPYFVPDRSAITALQLAALRGVDVRILIPDKPDHIGVYLSAFSYLDEVGHCGVKFYRYLDGFLHQKVFLIDGKAAAVGTANFDNRSFRLNFEITELVLDEGFAEEVEEMLEADFCRSRLMKEGETADKPWWFRFCVRLSRLVAPIQ